MTSIDGDWEFWREEGEDGSPDSGGTSGIREISRGSEKLLADCDFFSGKAFALSGKPIAFSHIISKTTDVSLQSRVAEVPDGSVDKASTGVSGGEDLQGVVPKKPWLSEVWGSAWIGMEVTEIDPCDRALATFDLWIE
jgi:hypothetical protein